MKKIAKKKLNKFFVSWEVEIIGLTKFDYMAEIDDPIFRENLDPPVCDEFNNHPESDYDEELDFEWDENYEWNTEFPKFPVLPLNI